MYGRTQTAVGAGASIGSRRYSAAAYGNPSTVVVELSERTPYISTNTGCHLSQSRATPVCPGVDLVKPSPCYLQVVPIKLVFPAFILCDGINYST